MSTLSHVRVVRAGRLAAPFRARTAAIVCALLFFHVHLFALDPAKSVFQFNCENWTRQSGLPADKINTITQSSDGMLWLGTQNGAVRFDGREFTAVPMNLPQAGGQEIRSLVAARDGGFWFAIRGGRFGRYDGHAFSLLDDPLWTLPALNANAVLETHDGTLWTAADPGFGRWTERKPGDRFFDQSIGITLALAESPSGRIWIGGVEHGLFYWENGKLAHVSDAFVDKQNISALAIDHDGRVWVGMGGGLRCFDADGTPQPIGPFECEAKALLVDRNGVVWIGTTGMGLARYEDGKFTYLHKADGLGSDAVTALFEDAEGSLWVGTQDGLSQISDVKFPIISNQEGLVGRGAIAVAPSRTGGIWATTAVGVSYLDGRTAKNFGGERFLNHYIRRVFEARSGDVFVGDGDKNIDVISNDAVEVLVHNTNWPEAFVEDDESVIVAVATDVFRIRDGGLEPFPIEGPRPEFYWINNLCVAHDGALWIASNHGIYRVKNGRVQQWAAADGLSQEKIHFILEDTDGSIWAGLPTGLARIKDGHVSSIKTENGLHDERIYAIVPDDLGYFWFSSGRGFFRVARTQLNDCADGKIPRVQCEVFDGLESVKFIDRDDQGFSGCKTSDGRIWFPSPHGVVMIDPANFVTNRIPPPVVIEQVRVKDAPLVANNNTRLEPGDDRVEFIFSALSYISPKKVRVRYQLEGLDSTWIDAGERRTVLYNGLRPGRYTFRVQACNADGVWNTKGASFSFELPPPFYQTAWFYAVCTLAAGAVLFGMYRWKLRHMAIQQEKLRAQNDRLESMVAARTSELAREHALLRALLDNSPDRIYFKDARSCYLKASRALAEKFGVSSPDELIGKSDRDFFTDEHARPALTDEQEIIRTGRPVIGKIEKEIRHDGRESWVLSSKMPLRDAANGIVGTFGVSKDITEIKQAEARLAELNRQFLETSRQAGMAEVATSVLHNVGNVLNSVNVSATLVAESVRRSEAAHLEKVCALLRRHEGDLATFFTADPKGIQVPRFLETLSEHLAAERKRLLDEVDGLRKNLEHIKEIVTMQQSYAKISGVAESVSLTDLAEDALRMNAGALVRHDVKLVRDYQSSPIITVEKHKVLQILVNLIRNAKYACDDSGRADKILTVQVTGNAQHARVAVIDNGVGIPAENLTRIFAHGFTTRKNGHGFGLHSGALAAREMGGALTAQSEGPGRGATFVLELPLQPPASTATAA